MSKVIFSEQQVEKLRQNPNVQACSERSITYQKNFKLTAVKEYQEGLSPNEIFKKAGFNIDLMGRKKPKWCLQSWKKVFKNKGIQGLSIETRGKSKSGGRPKTNWSNPEEKLKYLETMVAYLKAENAFLVKLRKQRLN